MFSFVLFLSTSALVFGHPAGHSHHHAAVTKLATELDAQQLTSSPKLKMTVGLEDIKIQSGVPHTLRCEILFTPSATIQWHHDGKRIQGDFDINVEEKMLNIGKSVVESGILASTFTIECPSSENSGTYTCEAQNGHQTVKSTAVIEIEGEDTECRSTRRTAPKIVQWTESRFEMEGNVATLICRANKAADWAWTFEGSLIASDNGRFEVLSNGDLRIKSITWADMGAYFCVARNNYGEERQETFLYPTSKTTN